MRGFVSIVDFVGLTNGLNDEFCLSEPTSILQGKLARFNNLESRENTALLLQTFSYRYYLCLMYLKRKKIIKRLNANPVALATVIIISSICMP